MGISRDSWHKRRATGGKMKQIRKKRKYELGRQPANTRIGVKRINKVRCRGGNIKYRALRLETGNFSWGSESVTRKTRIINVVYNASNNELVRTNTLVKSCIVQIDASPFKQWYEAHYGMPLLKKHQRELEKKKEAGEEIIPKHSNHVEQKLNERRGHSGIDPLMDDQFTVGRLYASVSSRPGQSGRADGYILEGKELEFYIKKIKAKKSN